MSLSPAPKLLKFSTPEPHQHNAASRHSRKSNPELNCSSRCPVPRGIRNQDGDQQAWRPGPLRGHPLSGQQERRGGGGGGEGEASGGG
jgi:hypothetical protein